MDASLASTAPPYTVSSLLTPFTTAAVVKATGCHPDTARKWRRAEIVPGTEHVRAIADLTGKSIDDVLTAIEYGLRNRALA